MHKYLLAGVSAFALVFAAGANAQELKFPKGEGAFSWDALQTFADAHKDLAGQKLTVLSDANGSVILTGDRFAWASDDPGAGAQNLMIQARALQFASR